MTPPGEGAEALMPSDTLRRALILVAVVTIAAVGLCVFDAHDSPGADLCGLFLALTVGLLATSPPLTAGRFLPLSSPVPTFDPLDFPAPPPRV